MKTKTLLLTALMCFVSSLLFSQEDGRIIYTDFDPDMIITPDTTCYDYYGGDSQKGPSIDMNNDGKEDFYFFREYNSAGWWYKMRVVNNFKMGCPEVGDTIAPLTELTYDTYVVEFTYSEMSYFAFRYPISNGEYCYGWARLYWDWRKNTGILYDMAYCTIPNYPLKFGQKSLTESLDDFSSNEMKLYPSPATDKVVLELPNGTVCKHIKIYSIDGRLLKCQNDNFENIDISILPSNIYIVEANLEDGIVLVEKIVKK